MIVSKVVAESNARQRGTGTVPSRATVDPRRIWREWHALPEGNRAPVKTIARRLGLPPSEIAALVYPPNIFGEWRDDQEPDQHPLAKDLY
jgi:hypothetical protein